MAVSRSSWFEEEMKTRCGRMSRQRFSLSLVPHLSSFNNFYWISTFQTSAAFKGLGMLQQRESWKPAAQLYLCPVPLCCRLPLCTPPSLLPWSPQGHPCLGGSSPVAPWFHVICSNSADQRGGSETFWDSQSGAVLLPALQSLLPSVCLCLPAGLNSFLSPPARVFCGRVAELAHGSFLYPAGRH